MAVYTTQLRSICESVALNTPGGYAGVNKIIESARPFIFDFDYPIFNPEYKSVLETKIIRHYYTQEIGLETVGLWKLKLETRMTEIMPYYNKLYESNELQFDVLTDYSYIKNHQGQARQDGSTDVTTSGETSNDRNASRDSTNNLTTSGTDKTTYVSDGTDNRVGDTVQNGSSKTTLTEDGDHSTTTDTAFSDTPQGGIGQVEDLEYLTNYTDVRESGKNSKDSTTNVTADNSTNMTDDLTTHRDDTTTVTYGKGEKATFSETSSGTESGKTSGTENRTNTLSSTDSYVETITGKLGGKSYPELIQEYRNTLINIDKMIIDELEDLFMIIF